jgi:hypothetical protein
MLGMSVSLSIMEVMTWRYSFSCNIPSSLRASSALGSSQVANPWALISQGSWLLSELEGKRCKNRLLLLEWAFISYCCGRKGVH